MTKKETIEKIFDEIKKERGSKGKFDDYDGDDFSEGVWIGYNSALKIIEKYL